MKIDLGCGSRTREGFTGVDAVATGPDVIVADLWVPPWPFDDESIEEVWSQHLVEHIPHYVPQRPETDGWWLFFGELYRVMQPGAIARIQHPYAKSDRAFMDPTHTRYINEASWAYLDRNWRQENQIDHYGDAGVDFEVEQVAMFVMEPDEVRHAGQDERELEFGRKYWFNYIDDLLVTLRRR